MKEYQKRFILLNMSLVGIVLFFSMIIVAIYMYNDYYDTMLSNMRLVAYHSTYPTDFLPEQADYSASMPSPAGSSSSSAETSSAVSEPVAEGSSNNTIAGNTSKNNTVNNANKNNNNNNIVDIYSPTASGDATPPAYNANSSNLSRPSSNTASGDATPNTNTASGDATSPGDAEIVSAFYSNNNDSVIISPGSAANKINKKTSSKKDSAAQNTADDTEIDEDADDNAYLEEVVRTALNQEDAAGLLRQYNMYYYKSADEDSTKIELTNSSYITNNMSKLIIRLIIIYAFLMFIFYLISYLISRMAVLPLEHALSMQRQFITDLSHDLKTPLTIILTNNSIIKSGTENNEKWIESTDTAAHNMLDMVNEMMDLSELDSMTKLSGTEPVCFSSIVFKASLQVESLCFENNIDFETDIEEDIYVNGHEDYLLRIATSLMENALKYEPRNGRIRVSLSSSKRRATFIVQNYTTVISAEDLPHIFERFYRADKARSNSQSHGLGLSIVHRMTQMMKGNISVSSTPADGTTFKVVFPQASVDLSK